MVASTRTSLIAYGLASLSCALGGWYVSLYSLNHDVGFFLQVAQHILQGERQYSDIIHSNTPFIAYFFIVPLCISHLFSLSMAQGFWWFSCAIMTIGALLSVHILFCNPRYRNALSMSFLAIAVPFLLFFDAEMKRYSDFGQREHLFLALFLPYACASLARLERIALPQWLKMLTGILGLVGCIIKPHFFLIYAAGELYLMVWSRNWRSAFRPESLLLAVGFFAAHAWVIIAYPNYVSMLPRLAAIYPGYEIPFAQFLLLALADYAGLGIFCLLVLFLLRRAGSTALVGAGYIITLIFAGFLAYLLHKAGFGYQAIPMIGFAFLLCIYLLLQTLNAADSKTPVLTFVSICVLLFPLVGVTQNLSQTYQKYQDAQKQDHTLYSRFHGQSVMLLSTGMHAGYPLIDDAGMVDVAHLSLLFYIPVYYADQRHLHRPAHYHSPADMPENERYFYDLTIDDIITRKPDLLLVDISADKFAMPGMQFDILQYFGQSPRFNAVFKDYRHIDAGVPDLEFYQRATP